MPDHRRVAIVGNASHYVGPELARHLAARGHDLVLGDPDAGAGGRARGRRRQRSRPSPRCGTWPVPSRPRRSSPPRSTASAGSTPPWRSSGQIVTGRFTRSTIEDLHTVVSGCLEAPYHFLKAVVGPHDRAGRRPDPPHHERRRRPRPTPGRSALLGGPRRGDDAGPQRRRRGGPQRRAGERGGHQLHGLPRVPRRLRRHRPGGASQARGTGAAAAGSARMEEFAAFCMAFIDGTSRFTTGQSVAYAGGWA